MSLGQFLGCIYCRLHWGTFLFINLYVIIVDCSSNGEFSTSMSRGRVTKISQRLQRLIDFTPRDCTTVDIGADHGICSVELSKFSKHTYCIDQSSRALEGARHLIANSPFKEKITIFEGDGVNPLLANSLKVDAAIIAGMGVPACGNILTNNRYQHQTTADTMTSGALASDFTALRAIELQHLTLQPYPPKLLSLIHLWKILLSSKEWDYDQQAVDFENDFFHITTSFRRTNKSFENVEKTMESDADIFRRSPLVANYCSHKLQPIESRAFRSYLLAQQKSLGRRCQGLQVNNSHQGNKQLNSHQRSQNSCGNDDNHRSQVSQHGEKLIDGADQSTALSGTFSLKSALSILKAVDAILLH